MKNFGAHRAPLQTKPRNSDDSDPPLPRVIPSTSEGTQASLDVHRPIAGSLTPKAFGVRDDRRCRALAAASVVEEFFCDGIVEILKVAHRDPSTRSTSLRAGFRSG